jgi:UDP-N-acetylmuramate--alanine ligase
MAETKSYFFCGIGGSGMLPLACIVRAQGAEVAGSDRSRDQARLGDKFEYLERLGIHLFDQDGSGLTSAGQILVTSAAVEETIPDVQAARRLGAAHLTRPQLLAELFNEAPLSIGVAGTSGKSTVTGMIGWILHEAGKDPTVMNGAVMKNFVTPDTPFASALAGRGEAFVSEVDESDGSIALYSPRIAVLNNISHDHKSMDELRGLFAEFLDKAGTAIVNVDDAEMRALAEGVDPSRLVTVSIDGADAQLAATGIAEEPLAVAFTLTAKATGESIPVRLQVPGRHNVANAVAALAAASAAGVPFRQGAEALSRFTGLRRRFDIVGVRDGITVIDDFGHNPDKIAATLATLHAFPGRLLLFFQPHGFGPLRTLRGGFVSCFSEAMKTDDVLLMCKPAFFGGTVQETVTSGDVISEIAANGRTAEYISERADCGRRLAELARPGDRIVIMGARDDTLSVFAREVLESL